jgi:hypothetical protein
MKSLFIFLYGLFLGILVSNISYYGIEYFLKKVPTQQCNSQSECQLKGIIETPNEEEEDNANSTNSINSSNIIKDSNLKNTFLYKAKQTISKIPLIKLILILAIIFVVIYLLYFYLKK